MQDKYGIELDVNISNFKAKMQQAKGEAKSLASELKTLTKGDIVGGEFINIFSNKISIASGKAKLLGDNFKLVKPAVKEAAQETQKLDTSIKQTSVSANVLGNNISKAFNRGLRSVKRLTLGFLGARSAFSLFRKYLNAYQNENELFNQKMMLTSNIITTALAPAFEFFGNMILYATVGLAKIIDIMFGTSITSKVLATGLSKATTQANNLSGGLDNISDSAKEMKDNLLGIDEITNLEQEGSGTGLLSGIGGGDLSGVQAQFDALDDLKKKMAEVDEWFNKHPGLTKFFKTLGEAIKLTKNAVVDTFKKIMESFGTGDFSWVGDTLVAGFELAAQLIEMIDWAGVGRTIGKTISSLILDTDWVKLGKSILKLIIKGATAIADIHFSLIDTGIDTLKNHILKKVGIDGKSIGGKLANAIATGYKAVIKTVTGALYNPLGTISKVGQAIAGLFKAKGGMFTGSWQPITAYAGGGTPSSGEMFMARESGPELVGTIGGHTAVMNNDQIVASVSAGVYQAVVSAMGGQNDRPIVLNINGKEFAKATYSDYQEESSRRGANTSIRRT